MKTQLIATAALLALGVQAQVSGPNRPGPGATPGTFQQPTTAGAPGALPGTAPTPATPQTGIGTPDARPGAVDPFASTINRRQDSINDSRNWDPNSGAPAPGDSGSGRLTPPPDVSPIPRPLEGSNPRTLDEARPRILGEPTRTTSPGSLDRAPGTTSPTTPRVSSDLNTSGINTPARVIEQPFDRALSAKIRAQLSQAPLGAQTTMRINPEIVRDLRITSQAGRVTLEGDVASQQERELIEKRAKEVSGVARIENRLRIRPISQGAPAPGQTGQSVRDAAELNDSHPEITPDR